MSDRNPGVTSHDTFFQLRSHLDGDDHFMNGHQIVKTREFRRQCPDWMKNKEKLAAFLLNRFPLRDSECKLGASDLDRPYCNCRPCRHRYSFLLWGYVIYECFLRQVTSHEAALDWNGIHSHNENLWITPSTVRRVVQMIRQAIAGKRLDGKPRSFGKPGRPRKSTCTAETAGGQTICPRRQSHKPSEVA